MKTIGIDPGLHGGLACWRPEGWMAAPMPTAGGEIDCGALVRWLREACGADLDVVVVLEKVGAMPKQGVSSTFKFGTGWGMVRGVCAALGFRLELVTPQAWKAEVLAGTAKDKAAAIAYCARTIPGLNLIPPGCRVPHDGVADAVCLSCYGARKWGRV